MISMVRNKAMMKTLSIIILILLGLNLYSQSTYSIPRKAPEYIPPSDLRLLEHGLRKRQTAYDQNRSIIQNKVNQVTLTLSKVMEKTTLTDSQVSYAKKFIETVGTIHKIDLSIESNAQSIYNWLDNVEAEFLNWL